MSVIGLSSPTRTRVNWLVFALWLVAFALGLYGLGQRALYGHELAAYGSYVPWGLWVALYIYFIGLSAGAFLISALIYVGGIKRLERVGKLALFTALVTLVAALLSIWLDLGHPERFWKVYTSARPTSMMMWMVWLYTGYFALVVAELWFALRGDLVAWASKPGRAGILARLLSFGSRDDSPVAIARDRKLLRVLGTLGVPLAIAFHGGVGALFGVIGARPFWNSSLYPILFLISALASGGALLTFVVAYLWPRNSAAERAEHQRTVTLLAQLTLGLVLLDLLMEWAEFSINLYAAIPAHAEAYRTVLFGPYWWVFWIGHLGLGSLIPIVILAWKGRSPNWAGGAGLLIAASFIAVRLNIVIPGLAVPELRGLESAFVDERLSFNYVPSQMEWLVALLVVSLAVALFYLGRRCLPLAEYAEVTATAERQAAEAPSRQVLAPVADGAQEA